MKKLNTRLNHFLSGYDFLTNSIDFRINSSAALEKWKNVQSFQLNQLANGKFYFSQEHREILLLKYDLWSKFLYEVENYCIDISPKNKKITKNDIDFIFELKEKVDNTFITTVSEHTQNFDGEFTSIWLETHKSIDVFLNDKINTFECRNVETFFTEMVDTLIIVLQHTLIEILELENFDCDNSPFLIVTQYNEVVRREFSYCLFIERLKIYKRHFNFSEICLTNYTSDPISSELAERIENMGIKINYKMSSRFR